MSKKIMYCFDGTWDTTKPEAKAYDTINTNVRKMYRAVISSSSQMAFYDSGIGSECMVLGATGSAIDEKIKHAYLQLAEVFQPGDELFLFGWSRGSYTARSFASMICDLGLPSQAIDKKVVDELFLVYRDLDRKLLLSKINKKYELYQTLIKFVGVLDTVGSLDVPAIHGGVSQPRYGFLDTSLHPNILNAYQAMAIDEWRQQFPILLWNLPYPPLKGQVLDQIWFAGSHDDGGGGYPENDPGLSQIPFKWMAEKVSSLGMKLDPAVLEEHPEVNAKQALSPVHASWSKKDGRRDVRIIPDNSFLSNSVAYRCENDATYRPENLKFVNEKLADSYQIIKVLNID